MDRLILFVKTPNERPVLCRAFRLATKSLAPWKQRSFSQLDGEGHLSTKGSVLLRISPNANPVLSNQHTTFRHTSKAKRPSGNDSKRYPTETNQDHTHLQGQYQIFQVHQIDRMNVFSQLDSRILERMFSCWNAFETGLRHIHMFRFVAALC